MLQAISPKRIKVKRKDLDEAVQLIQELRGIYTGSAKEASKAQFEILLKGLQRIDHVLVALGVTAKQRDPLYRDASFLAPPPDDDSHATEDPEPQPKSNEDGAASNTTSTDGVSVECS